MYTHRWHHAPFLTHKNKVGCWKSGTAREHTPVCNIFRLMVTFTVQVANSVFVSQDSDRRRAGADQESFGGGDVVLSLVEC